MKRSTRAMLWIAALGVVLLSIALLIVILNTDNGAKNGTARGKLVTVPIEIEGDRPGMSLDEFQRAHPRARVFAGGSQYLVNGSHSAIRKSLFDIPDCGFQYDFDDNHLATVNIIFKTNGTSDHPAGYREVLQALEANYGPPTQTESDDTSVMSTWSDGSAELRLRRDGSEDSWLVMEDIDLVKAILQRVKKSRQEERNGH